LILLSIANRKETNDKRTKINFIIEQEKQQNNSWKWILKADTETVNELYEYWTQEEDPNITEGKH